MTRFFIIVFTAVFVENFAFTKFYGIELFPVAEKSEKNNAVKALIFIFLTTFTGTVNWLINKALLRPLNAPYLDLIAAMFLCIGIYFAGKTYLPRFLPRLFEKTGGEFLTMCINSGVVACCLVRSEAFTGTAGDFFTAIAYSFASSLGFVFAVAVYHGVKNKLENSAPPKAFEGLPITLLTLGLIAVAFSGFLGVKF